MDTLSTKLSATGTHSVSLCPLLYPHMTAAFDDNSDDDSLFSSDKSKVEDDNEVIVVHTTSVFETWKDTGIMETVIFYFNPLEVTIMANVYPPDCVHAQNAYHNV